MNIFCTKSLHRTTLLSIQESDIFLANHIAIFTFVNCDGQSQLAEKVTAVVCDKYYFTTRLAS